MKKIFLLLLLFFTTKTYAGMPIVRFNDLAQMRLEAISFFLMIILISPFFVKLIWNSIVPELTSLPKINYMKAFGLVFLWGMAFNLILVMISGGRELMTPGAWEPQGITYKVKKETANDLKKATDDMRQKDLEKLRTALWKYAQEHNNKFPINDYLSDIPEDLWETIHPQKLRFNYRYGLKVDEGEQVLAYEPGVFGKKRYVLFNNGEIKYMPISKIIYLIQRNPIE